MQNGHHVLLVDDDRDILTGVTFRLKAAGYETSTALDGEEAIASAIRQHPDAIIMDIRMPRLDGMSAMNRLKARDDTREIPIVMLSASLVDQQAALDNGARFFLTKPFQGNELLAALDTVVDEAHLQSKPHLFN